MSKYYFEKPAQIKFIDFSNLDELTWCGGIALGNEFICCCCGALIDIDEYLEDWEDYQEDYADFNVEEPIIIFKEWADINEYILD